MKLSVSALNFSLFVLNIAIACNAQSQISTIFSSVVAGWCLAVAAWPITWD